jgi:hypothetical protein
MRWLLYSPRRAVKALLGLALVLALAFTVGAGQVLAKLPSAPSPDAQPSSSPSNTSSTATPGQSGVVKDAAERFMRAWLSADRDKAAWADRMRPFATKRLLDLTVLTDPAIVPTTTLRSAYVVATTPTFSSVVVELSNGVALAVTMTSTGNGTWLADDLRPVGT